MRLEAREKGVEEKGALKCARALSILARRSLGNIGRSFWDTGEGGGLSEFQ
jgi:hypothetical protein